MKRAQTFTLGLALALAVAVGVRSASTPSDVPFRCPICGGDTSDFEALLAFQERTMLLVVLGRFG